MHHAGRIHSSSHPQAHAHAHVKTSNGRFAQMLGELDPVESHGSAPDRACHGSLQAVSRLDAFLGRSTGSGQCVALVRATHPHLGPTALWVRGAPVQGNTAIPRGTPIATFSRAGHYVNATDGSSHAAIYLGQTAEGVQVLDQWAGRAAAVRTIPWHRPGAAAANTGAAFHVVDTRSELA